jgi:hypothetical protein
MRRASFENAVFQNEKSQWSNNKTKRVLQSNIARVRGTKVRSASRNIAPTFLSQAQDEGEGSTSRPGRFIYGKEPRYPLNRRTGGFRSRSGRFLEKSSGLAGFELQPVQPVAESVYHLHYSGPSWATC